MCLPYSIEKKLPQPRSTQEIDAQELIKILRDRFPDEGVIFISDRKYKLCNVEDMRIFFQLDTTNQKKYIAEDYDCDDYARRLWGQLAIPKWSCLAFGICWTDLHALNIFIDEDKMLWFMEPQSDAFSSGLAPWQGTKIRFIAI